MTSTKSEVGEQFVLALSQKDEAGLRVALASDVRFRGLTPARAWEAIGVDDTLNVPFGSWFETTDHIDEMVAYEIHDVVDKIAIRYCFRVRNAEGDFLVEQQGYVSLDEQGRMADVAIVCSGYRPVDGPSARSTASPPNY